MKKISLFSSSLNFSNYFRLKNILPIVGFILLSFTSLSQTTAIPDDKFEEVLIAKGIDTNGKNNTILNRDAQKEVGTLYLDEKGISNLTGIEAFTSLSGLFCMKNNLTSLNLTSNTALTVLDCSDNQLTSLNLTGNTALRSLVCSDNQLTSLNISKNIIIDLLYCTQNNLTSLDLSKHEHLIDLIVDNNQLTSLDVSKSVWLADFRFNNNQLTNIDVSKNVGLNFLECNNNQLSSLNLSNNIKLRILNCRNNRLTSLNIHNGNNALIVESLGAKPGWFQTTGNPDLICIQVDDAIFSRNNFRNIDSHTSFSEDCNIPSVTTTIPDTNFEQALIDSGYDTGSPDGTVLTANVANITSLDIRNKQITNLTGIEAFIALTELRCNNNQLTTLNLSSNAALTILDCSDNQLTYLNVKNGSNMLLASFNAINNLNLTCIQVDDVNYSTTTWRNIDNTVSFSTADCSPITIIPDTNFEQALIELNIDTNGKNGSILNTDVANINSLNVSSKRIRDLTGIEAFTALTELICKNNQLTTLNLNGNIALIDLDCSDNQLTTLNLKGNIALTDLDCTDNHLTSLNLSENTALTNLICKNNRLTTLDATTNTALTVLSCKNNRLTTLDVTTNTALASLACNNNQLKNLNLSNNTKLSFLWCQNNQLTSLNIKNGHNTDFRTPYIFFQANDNPNLICIQVDDKDYSTSNWLNIDNTASFSENCTALVIEDIETGFSISPNPAAGILNITVDEKADYRLLNIRGQTLKTGTISAGKSSVNLLPLAKGVYLLNIKTNQGNFTKRIIVL